MESKEFKEGDDVFYAGAFYKIAEIKEFPHGVMIGIYDEPPSKRVDYLNPKSVNKTYPCHNCQGGGCGVCLGYGILIE